MGVKGIRGMGGIAGFGGEKGKGFSNIKLGAFCFIAFALAVVSTDIHTPCTVKVNKVWCSLSLFLSLLHPLKKPNKQNTHTDTHTHTHSCTDTKTSKIKTISTVHSLIS